MPKRKSGLSDDEKLILLYKLQTGITDPSMPDVAEWAELQNYKRMPKAKTPRELLAKRLSRSARQQMREDTETGFFGRANLAYQVVESGEAKVRWFDPKAPTATREKFAKARTLRREQMVGDGFQYAVDDLLWNRDHPNDPQFVLDLNITEDVMWRMNGIAAEKKAS